MTHDTTREITPDDIESLAVGAWILGTGGGGSPYLGLLNMRRLYAEGRRVRLMSPDDLADDDAVAVVSNMGAPLVGQERLTDSRNIARAVELMEQFTGKRFRAIMSLEIGGGNAIQPLMAAAHLDRPVVDADCMGRAYPEAQMTSLCDFEVDARGAFVGPLEVEPAVNRAIESCLRRGVLKLAEADRQRATLVSPRNRHGLVKPVRDLWDQWCGAWDGRVARPGVGERVELSLPMGAEAVPAAATRTLVLVSRSEEACVVRLSTVQDGEEFARVVDRLSNAQVPDGQRKTITQCRREVQAEAEFAPGLKLLRYQHTTRATTMYEGAAEPLLEQETRSFSIDWTPKPFGPEPASEEAPEGRQGGEQRGDSRREDGR